MNRSVGVVMLGLMLMVGVVFPQSSAHAATFPNAWFSVSGDKINFCVSGEVGHLRITWGERAPGTWSMGPNYYAPMSTTGRCWLLFSDVLLNDQLFVKVEVSDNSSFPPQSPTTVSREYRLRTNLQEGRSVPAGMPNFTFPTSGNSINMCVSGPTNHIRLTWGERSPGSWSMGPQYLGTVGASSKCWLLFSEVRLSDSLFATVEVSRYSTFPPRSPDTIVGNYTLRAVLSTSY